MKTWIRKALMICCLGLSGFSVGAAADTNGDGGGIFSSILMWFQGRTADAALTREDDGGDVTPSHVHQATLDLIAEIGILRRATGVAGVPADAEAHEDQSAIHAFAKSLEVMEKTARFQKRLGMIPVDVERMPVRNITQKDVHRNVRAVIEELRRVKRQLVIEDRIQPAPFAGGKTPSLVYRNLRDASLLLDGLVGRPATFGDVHANVLRIHDEMELIAATLRIAIEHDPPPIEGGRELKEVAQQVLRATYKVINLQSGLGMDPSDRPHPALVRMTPAEVLDATNILLAEMARVKTHLNIRLPPAERPESRDKISSDTFARILLVIRNLDIMTRAVGHAGG